MMTSSLVQRLKESLKQTKETKEKYQKKCKKCDSILHITTVQTRSADEGMTTILTCHNCKKITKIF